jgi:hypothetical protein
VQVLNQLNVVSGNLKERFMPWEGEVLIQIYPTEQNGLKVVVKI